MELKKYSKQIISVLIIIGAFGCLNIYISNDIDTSNNKANTILFIGIIFIIISIYFLILYMYKINEKPKKKLLFLKKCKDNIAVFVDEKGNIYEYANCNKEENKCYYVLKTHNKIYEILESVPESQSFINMGERRYWTNFYTKNIKTENNLILPLVYIILLIGIFSLKTLSTFDKITSSIYITVLIYIIIYDFVYKQIQKKSNDVNKDISKLNKVDTNIKKITIIIINIFIISAFILNMKGMEMTIMLMPYVVYVILFSLIIIFKINNNKELERIFTNIYTILLFLSHIYIFLYIFFVILQFGTSIELFVVSLILIFVIILTKILIPKLLIKKDK